MKDDVGGWAQFREALARRSSAGAEHAFGRTPRSTPSGSHANQSIGDIFSAIATNKFQKTCKTSGWTAIYGLRGVTIRKKVIGHGTHPISAGFRGGKHIRDSSGAFALLEKPARQQSGRILLHPLIDQSANLLPKIGGMGKTGQFKTL